MVPPTIAIIGAGPSGLVSAKEGIENGLIPVVFEKHGELGGVWNPTTGSVWNSMRTNISKFTTVFGDHPHSEDTEMFPRSATVFGYLKDYASTWGLMGCIRFCSEVLSVEPEPDNSGSWKVSWNCRGSLQSQIFSGVIIATGIFAKGFIPQNIPGLSTFPGKILHSSDYKDGKDFRSQRVLTVGGSLSGVEIAADVSKHSEQSFHSFRSPFWVLGRYLSSGSSTLPLDLLFYNRKFYSQQPTPGTTRESVLEENRKKNTNLAALASPQQKLDAIRILESSFSQPINITVSDSYVAQLEAGRVSAIPSTTIQAINGSSITFSNGAVLEGVDTIIFATGYRLELGFLGKSVLEAVGYDAEDPFQPLILFQELFHPSFPSLFFVGMYKGPFLPVIEQQARFAGRVLGGRIPLPPHPIIAKGLEDERGIREKEPRPQFPHPEYVLFADTIATLGKSFPDLDKLRGEGYSLKEAMEDSLEKTSAGVLARLEGMKGEIAERFMTSPVIPAHYNFTKSPKDVLDQMDFVDQVLKQFEQ